MRRSIGKTVLLALATISCGRDKPTAVPTPSPSRSPTLAPTTRPLPFQGTRELVITVSPSCAGQFPRSLRQRRYTVDVKASTDRSWLYFPETLVYTGAYLRPSPVEALLDFYGRAVLFDFLMQEVLSSRPLGDSMVEEETFDITGRANLPFMPDSLEGPLVGTILWRRNQVDPPASECTSDTHAMLLQP